MCIRDSIKSLCQSLKVPVIAGNCVTYEVSDLLMKAGVAGLMVGIGPGAACTSRGVLGIGIPRQQQYLTAVQQEIIILKKLVDMSQ